MALLILSVMVMHKRKLSLQMIYLILYVCIVLSSLIFLTHSTLLWAVGASSLASSGYIVFTTPNSPTSRGKSVVGSYIIASAIGFLFHILLSQAYLLGHHYFNIHPHFFWLSASLSVGLCMLLMMLTRLHHPPAVGIALIAVFDITNYWIFLGFIADVNILVTIKRLLGKHLVDLAH